VFRSCKLIMIIRGVVVERGRRRSRGCRRGGRMGRGVVVEWASRDGCGEEGREEGRAKHLPDGLGLHHHSAEGVDSAGAGQAGRVCGLLGAHASS